MSVMTVPLVQNADGTWGSPSPAWDHLINRESSGNPTIIQQITDVNSGGNEAEGLFQITPRTWNSHGGREFAPSPRRATPQQQAIVAARIFTANPSGSDWGAGRPGREDAQQLAAGLIPTDQGAPVTDPNRPDFNEYPMWSPNNSSRGGTKVDLFLLHTQEGDGNADSLARFLQGHEVSYHYSVSEDYNDHGVTVVDVVDTDYASWSVLSANPRSINLCFAGSRAGWTRDQWMKQSRAIDVAAYLAVQDCKKYGIPLVVIGTGGNYSAARAGVSDHQYVTQILKDGTHTDVGKGFPVDYFKERFNFWAGSAPVTPQPGGPPVSNVPDYTHETWDQVRGRWAMLGGKTLVEAIAQIRDKVCGTNDAGKTGVEFD